MLFLSGALHHLKIEIILFLFDCTSKKDKKQKREQERK